MKFKVWETLRSEEQFAEEFDSSSAEEAAIAYAEGDIDSLDDYYERAQPICVQCVDTGIRCMFEVYAEAETTFYVK